VSVIDGGFMDGAPMERSKDGVPSKIICTMFKFYACHPGITIRRTDHIWLSA
jgi:hypothetical protein